MKNKLKTLSFVYIIPAILVLMSPLSGDIMINDEPVGWFVKALILLVIGMSAEGLLFILFFTGVVLFTDKMD